MINQRIADLVCKGKECFNRGEYRKAQLFFNEVIEGGGESSEAFFCLGNIFHLKGEIGKAIKAFNKVLELDPCHTDASISLSILYNDVGRYEDGKRIFDITNERIKQKKNRSGVEDKHINRKFSERHYELAEMYMTYNRFDEALFEYNKVIALNSDNLEARIKVAQVYAKKGFMSKAFDELKRLKNEYPAYLSARVALGILYYGTGKVLEAQSEWKRVLAKEPHNTEASMYLNLSKTATETSLQ